MTDLRQIEIDLEVHKRIEIAKGSFAETENDVLRRLLGIDSALQHHEVGRAWSGKGVTLPRGTQVQMEYTRSAPQR